MTRGTVPERYVALCLCLGTHVEDFVDAYIGSATLREKALADGAADPRALRDERSRCLRT